MYSLKQLQSKWTLVLFSREWKEGGEEGQDYRVNTETEEINILPLQEEI